MKFTRYFVLFVALSFLSGIPAHADEAASPGETAVDGGQCPVVSPDTAAQDETLLEQAVYEVLLAEVAFQRGDAELAMRAYADLAQRTRDPRIMERAIEVAEFARRFDLALETAHLWLEVDPASQRAQKMLTGVLIMSKQFDELAPHLIRMMESDKAALPGSLLGLNRMFAHDTDRLAVFRLIDTVCRPFFGLAEAHYAVALAAASARMSERARREAVQALELRPEWETAALLRAQLLVGESRDEAIEFLEGFLEGNPDAEQARLLLARILVGERRYVDARRQLDRLLRDFPGSPEIAHSVAILALQSGDKALAEAQLKNFIAFDKVPDRNAAYYFLGQIAEDDGRIDEAMSRYAQVLPGEHYLAAQARQAHLLFEQGKIDEGRELLRNTRTSRPEELVQMQIAEASLLRGAGRVQEAFDFLEQRLAEDPEQADLLYESALLADQLNKPDLMENRLRRLIELHPDNPQAYNALGYAYADRNERLPEARRLIERALALAPDDVAILDSMGWVLFRQGDLPGALSYLERSFGKREDPEIAAHLGEVLWVMGRQDDAWRLLSDARKKFPSNAVLSETTRRLAP
ncbi:MAG: tetratricopeptide repeat protein [Candidatus Accumulibacter sp.]|jgi:tetratricopeptide (TPR) repeat protein|nr:tetratricopeptide repeat protein [Accumulibacter sp.]